MQSIASKQTSFNHALVTINVADMQRSIDFFTMKLGLRLKSRYGNEFAVVEAPGLAIGLHPSSETRPAGAVSIGFAVDDVEEGRKQLQGRGVATEGDIVVDPPMRFVFLKDPDGVQLYLAEQSEFT